PSTWGNSCEPPTTRRERPDPARTKPKFKGRKQNQDRTLAHLHHSIQTPKEPNVDRSDEAGGRHDAPCQFANRSPKARPRVPLRPRRSNVTSELRASTPSPLEVHRRK